MINETKKNHYNPCFWTAHWNPQYFEEKRQGIHRLRARDAPIYALNVKADKVLTSTCKDVHYDKHIGIAEITMEVADDFCRRNHPKLYEDFKRELRPEDYPVCMDFEELFRGMEQNSPYRTLLEVIKRGSIVTDLQKTYIAHFVVWHVMRSHAIINSMIEMSALINQSQFEHLMALKWSLADPEFMASWVLPLFVSRWRLYHLDADTFPLCDSPILVKPENLMVALSPRHLLVIDRTCQDTGCWHRNRIDAATLAEFRARTIGNTFREIIFGERRLLDEWRDDPKFRERVQIIRNMNGYNDRVSCREGPDGGSSELWKLNALGNQ